MIGVFLLLLSYTLCLCSNASLPLTQMLHALCSMLHAEKEAAEVFAVRRVNFKSLRRRLEIVFAENCAPP